MGFLDSFFKSGDLLDYNEKQAAIQRARVEEQILKIGIGDVDENYIHSILRTRTIKILEWLIIEGRFSCDELIKDFIEVLLVYFKTDRMSPNDSRNENRNYLLEKLGRMIISGIRDEPEPDPEEMKEFRKTYIGRAIWKEAYEEGKDKGFDRYWRKGYEAGYSQCLEDHGEGEQ